MRWAVGLILAVTPILRADAPKAVALPEFSAAPILAVAREAAEKAGEPVNGVALAPAGTARQRGDTSSFLITAEEGKNLQQWVVSLSTGEVAESDRALRTAPSTFYSNTGHQVNFPPSPLAAVWIHVLGPYSAKKGAGSAKDIKSGTLVNPLFLEMGLETSAGLIVRLNEQLKGIVAQSGEEYGISMNSSPIPAEEIARQRRWVDRVKITDDEARSFAGFVPALLNFFQIASQTPGLRDIVFEAIDVPWWSLAKNGGRLDNVGFQFVGAPEPLRPADWALPDNAKMYSLGLILMLLDKPALHCRLAVTEPNVPLVNSAGIVGITVVRPNGKGPHITVRLLAARPAGVDAK